MLILQDFKSFVLKLRILKRLWADFAKLRILKEIAAWGEPWVAAMCRGQILEEGSKPGCFAKECGSS
jgi:hypothetical protein